MEVEYIRSDQRHLSYFYYPTKRKTSFCGGKGINPEVREGRDRKRDEGRVGGGEGSRQEQTNVKRFCMSGGESLPLSGIGGSDDSWFLGERG